VFFLAKFFIAKAILQKGLFSFREEFVLSVRKSVDNVTNLIARKHAQDNINGSG